MDQSRPHKMTGDLTIIADQLSALADGLRSSTDDSVLVSPPQVMEKERETFLLAAKRTYANRRRRENILGNSHLLGEPAWDILLDLYIARGESHEVSVSSACIGSASPATTGLRWLGVLQKAGLVERVDDPEDQRRVLVRLSSLGVEQMERYFAAVGGIEPSAIYSGTQQSAVQQGRSAQELEASPDHLPNFRLT